MSKVIPEPTAQQKLDYLGRVYDAIERAKETLESEPSHKGEVAIQRLQQQASSVRATLPKLRLVT